MDYISIAVIVLAVLLGFTDVALWLHIKTHYRNAHKSRV